MRLLALSLCAAALAACGSGGGGTGKGAGEACASATECARGLVCFEAVCAAEYLASPGCTPTGAPAIVAGDPVMLPVPPPNTCLTDVRDPFPPGEFVHLGDFPVGTELTLDVPAGTSSVTLFSQEVNDSAVDLITFQGFALPNTVVPTDVRLPGGALFFSDTEPLPTDDAGYQDVTGVLAYYAGFTPISGAFTLPNTAASLDLVRTAAEVPPGTWRFTVNDWAQECLGVAGCSGGSDAGTYRIHAYAKPGPFASTGTLDLEVYLATDELGPLPNAAAAASHPQIARWVEALSGYFANAGICLGTVTFRDLPPWVKDRYAPGGVVDISGAGIGLPPEQTPPGCDDLSQLFTAGMAPSRAVHLFLAEELQDPFAGDLGTVLGIDGSIPGPSGVPGTIHGGAIVGFVGALGSERVPGACAGPGTGDFDCATDVLAYVAAHEAGHWLGLYHTTEFHGALFDPLSDTGTCRCDGCASSADRLFCGAGGAVVEASVCASEPSPVLDVASRAAPGLACTGAQNLMFWQLDPGRAEGRISRQQGEVMRLNPAVR